MTSEDTLSWNLRDDRLARTLRKLAGHLGDGRGRKVEIVVWTHKWYIGDVRATCMGRRRGVAPPPIPNPVAHEVTPQV